MNKNCPQCGEELIYKEGFSKMKNKPWKGYFCPNRGCGFVDWVKVKTQASFGDSNYQSSPSQSDILSESINNMHKVLMEIYKIDVALYKELIKNKMSYGEQTSKPASEGADPSESGQ